MVLKSVSEALFRRFQLELEAKPPRETSAENNRAEVLKSLAGELPPLPPIGSKATFHPSLFGLRLGFALLANALERSPSRQRRKAILKLTF